MGITIALDCMGGDHGPHVTVPAAASFLQQRPDTRILLVGRESAGVPETVHAAADARIVVPMRPGFRSLNVAVTAAMVVGEALRQTGGFVQPEGETLP